MFNFERFLHLLTCKKFNLTKIHYWGFPLFFFMYSHVRSLRNNPLDQGADRRRAQITIDEIENEICPNFITNLLSPTIFRSKSST